MEMQTIRNRSQVSGGIAIGTLIGGVALSAAAAIALAILIKKDVVSFQQLTKSIPGIVVISAASTGGFLIAFTIPSAFTFHYYRKKQIEDLETQVENLEGEKGHLEFQKDELTRQKDELTRQKDELTRQKDELETQKDELKTQKDELRQQNEALEKRLEVEIKKNLKLTPDHIAKVEAFFRDPKNQPIINQRIQEAKANKLPFAAFRPGKLSEPKDIPGVPFRVEYFYKENLIFIKYNRAFANGNFGVVSKVYEVNSHRHFAEKLMLGNESFIQRYYSFKRGGKPSYVPPDETDLARINSVANVVNNNLKNVPEVLKIFFSVNYTKSHNHSSQQKILQYTPLQKGEIAPEAFKDEKSKIQAVKGIVKALANLHRAGYRHGDVKGPNFTHSKEGVKVIDLNDLSSVTDPIRFTGTPLYYSPEFTKFIYDDRNTVVNGVKSESWSLGIAILNDIFGILTPWTQIDEATNPNALADFKKAILDNSSVIDFSQVPASIRPAVAGLLERDPSKRWSAKQADEFLDKVNV